MDSKELPTTEGYAAVIFTVVLVVRSQTMPRGNDDPKQQRKNRRKFSEQLHEVLFEYGYGEITEWVIERCPYFQRVAWTIILLETLFEDYLEEAEIVDFFGQRFANNLRKGRQLLSERIATQFPEEWDAA